MTRQEAWGRVWSWMVGTAVITLVRSLDADGFQWWEFIFTAMPLAIVALIPKETLDKMRGFAKWR